MPRISILRSSTLKLALIYIGLFSAAVFALFGYVYWSTLAYARSQADRAIAAEHSHLVRAYDRGGRAALLLVLRQRLAEERPEGGFYLLADPGRAPIAGNLPDWPGSLGAARGWANFAAGAPESGAADRIALRAHYATLPDGSHLLVGREMADFDAFVAAIRTAFAGAIALMFVLAAVATVSVTRRTVGRIEAINATSREIMRSGLSTRIPLRGSRDEWDRLAENLNSMLDRIEELVHEIKQVSDNVAHDLRTPLTRMRARLERAWDERLAAEQFQTLIGSTIAELDGLLAAFSSMLRIAQIEARDRRTGFRPLDLSEVAGAVAELFDAAAEERGGRIELNGPGRVGVIGDRDLLFDAIANLVDNALKHGGDGGQVTIEIGLGPDGPLIAVCDRGPGIPVGERKRVLKRFYRLERSRSTPGNGLGLSLVAAVAHLHGAEIDMASNTPGLRIELRFPVPVTPLQAGRRPAAPGLEAGAASQGIS